MLFAANCHANYWGYDGIVQNQTYQVEFTPRIVQNSTYWATMSVGSIGGYGGIQQAYSSNPATDHGGLFSIWDSTSTNADSFVIGFNSFISFNNYSFRFGGEGTGAQLIFKWPWLLDKPYRMAWRRYVEPSNTMARYEGFYFDPYDTNTLGWVWVGTIRKPVTTDSQRNMQGFEGFSEDFGGNPGIRQIEIRNVWLLNLNNQWLNITNANMLDARDQAVLTSMSGGWRHHSYDTNQVFTPVSNLPMLPANDLAPIYLPYHINCGWGSTNVATSAQVAASLSRAFESDAFWYGVSATNYTASAINVSGVTNAAPSLLYQSRREGTNFGYRLFGQQPSTPCLVRLHFAETDFNSLGARVQTVIINSSMVESNLDIRATAGAQNRAVVRDYYVNAGTNGIVDISFQSQIPGVAAVVSGIEVNGLLPQLAWHPQSATNLQGTTAQFSATVVGTPPLSYQWQKNSTNLVGQTNTTLTLNGVTTNDTANYVIVVSNAYGSVTSATASLWVAALSPTITSQPQNQSVILGWNANFYVTATGVSPLLFQWFFKTNTILANATNTTLTLTNIQTSNMGSYSVIVTNALGSVTSAVATLTVLVPPTISLQPTNQMVLQGNSATFSVTANGTAPLSFQWYSSAILNTNYDELVAGVSTLAYPGAVLGSVVPQSMDWWPIAKGAVNAQTSATVMAAREYFGGRVVAFGHGVMVDGADIFDNDQLRLNMVHWLNSSGNSNVMFSSGHGEGNDTNIKTLITQHGFNAIQTVAPLTSNSLASAAVLIVDASLDFTTNEIETVRQFVQAGGGLCMSGLGWWWVSYHPGQTMADYPMVKVAAPFQITWGPEYVSDPNNLHPIKTLLVGKTNSSLMFSPVAATNAGFYVVRVMNVAGTVFSDYVSLTVSIPRPSISQPQVTIDKAFSLLVSGEIGRQYRVQASTNLVSWVDITNLISTTESWQFIDPFFTNFPRRFYRVASP